MKIRIIFYAFLFFCLLTGCAAGSFNLQSLSGVNIKDLALARAQGREETFPLSYKAAFARVENILKKNNLTVFRSNEEKRYIVTIGFRKQVDTTRVGIFFDPAGENSTKITLSCLSLTALEKANNIIFGQLKKDASS